MNAKPLDEPTAGSDAAGVWAPATSPTVDHRGPPFHSVLFRNREEADAGCVQAVPDCFRDLNLDPIVDAITTAWKDYALEPFFRAHLREVDAVVYRQEVMRDLEQAAAMAAVKAFTQQMRSLREQLARAEGCYYRYEKARHVVGAMQTYADAVEQFGRDLAALPLASRGLRAIRADLDAYRASPGFGQLVADVRTVLADLAAIRYGVLIRGASVTVQPCAGEIDYTAAVEQTFEKFRRGEVRDYRAKLPEGYGMNHIEAQILDRVALLHPQAFRALDACCRAHAAFQNEGLLCFDREVHVYVAYLAWVDGLRQAGLPFCYPTLSATDKAVDCRDAFDPALAQQLIGEHGRVVCNDFSLQGAERIFVVSGPNQGGKTTFARMFGQLHWLAAWGGPVPGTQARLFLFDRLFTHFEREEDIRNLRGKLHDDLVRIHRILGQASPHSIVVMNEIFSSTTLEDALFLSREVMARLSRLDLLGVCVTFLEELASFDEKVVSLVGTMDPADPTARSFRLARRPADGLAYALAIAQKYGVTRGQLLERIPA